jgi:hypothetical protein
VDPAKTVVLRKVPLVILNHILGILSKLLLPEGAELAGIAVLFEKQAIALAVRIAAEVSGSHANIGKVAVVDFKPTVSRILVFDEGSVHAK